MINLQKRAAGVLPVRVDVPRAGVAHQFVKPLVVDRETMVTLKYKRRWFSENVARGSQKLTGRTAQMSRTARN